MKVISLPQDRKRDRESLLLFLEGCREQARAKSHPQLASISLRVREMDPLAVWEAVYDPDEHHFYLEEPSDGVSIAASGAVLSTTASGSTRYEQIRCWSEEWLANTLVIGDIDLPLTGPHFFGGFAFEDQLPEREPFAPATAFVPRWQVSSHNGLYGAVANVLVEVDSDVGQLAERILAAHDKFYSFDYQEESGGGQQQAQHARPDFSAEEETRAVYENNVERALAAIEEGRIQKIVLSRTQDITASHAFFPPLLLDRLRKRYPTCRIFSMGRPGEVAFLGATPERLVRIHNGILQTEAIAGTIPTSESAREDLLLGERLLASDKDLREHRFVVDTLIERLQAGGLHPQTEDIPKLLKLSNVQHLWTPITARVGEDSILRWVGELQPTPAVGGNPRDLAMRLIGEWEPLPRGLYCGSVGWWNHHGEGEFVVGIRCALVRGSHARLWAGAGIVEGSRPEREWQETVVKLAALREVFEKPFALSEWES